MTKLDRELQSLLLHTRPYLQTRSTDSILAGYIALHPLPLLYNSPSDSDAVKPSHTIIIPKSADQILAVSLILACGLLLRWLKSRQRARNVVPCITNIDWPVLIACAQWLPRCIATRGGAVQSQELLGIPAAVWNDPTIWATVNEPSVPGLQGTYATSQASRNSQTHQQRPGLLVHRPARDGSRVAHKSQKRNANLQKPKFECPWHRHPTAKCTSRRGFRGFRAVAEMHAHACKYHRACFCHRCWSVLNCARQYRDHQRTCARKDLSPLPKPQGFGHGWSRDPSVRQMEDFIAVIGNGSRLTDEQRWLRIFELVFTPYRGPQPDPHWHEGENVSVEEDDEEMTEFSDIITSDFTQQIVIPLGSMLPPQQPRDMRQLDEMPEEFQPDDRMFPNFARRQPAHTPVAPPMSRPMAVSMHGHSALRPIQTTRPLVQAPFSASSYNSQGSGPANSFSSWYDEDNVHSGTRTSGSMRQQLANFASSSMVRNATEPVVFGSHFDQSPTQHMQYTQSTLASSRSHQPAQFSVARSETSNAWDPEPHSHSAADLVPEALDLSHDIENVDAEALLSQITGGGSLTQAQHDPNRLQESVPTLDLDAQQALSHPSEAMSTSTTSGHTVRDTQSGWLSHSVFPSIPGFPDMPTADNAAYSDPVEGAALMTTQVRALNLWLQQNYGQSFFPADHNDLERMLRAYPDVQVIDTVCKLLHRITTLQIFLTTSTTMQPPA